MAYSLWNIVISWDGEFRPELNNNNNNGIKRGNKTNRRSKYRATTWVHNYFSIFDRTCMLGEWFIRSATQRIQETIKINTFFSAEKRWKNYYKMPEMRHSPTAHTVNDAPPIMTCTQVDEFSRPMEPIERANSFPSPLTTLNRQKNECNTIGPYVVSAGDSITPSRVRILCHAMHTLCVIAVCPWPMLRTGQQNPFLLS